MTLPVFSELNLPIQTRRSIRAFADTPIAKHLLVQIMEAARWVSSCNNEQPWRFVVACRNTNPQSYDAMLETLVPFNQDWAKTAPVLIAAIARTTFEKNNQPNLHAYYDLGQAVGQLSIQAQTHQIFVHQMAGFDIEKAKTRIQIPDGFDILAMIALGYAADDISMLPEALQAAECKPRARKPQEEFVFGSVFGSVW